MSEDRRHNREAGAQRPLAELLSAYLDDRDSLSTDELTRVEQLLDTDPAARQMHAELGLIRQELGKLDPLPAPRAYHLDAEMVGAPEPVVLQESQAWYARHTAQVRWATAAAAILFVFVLGADLVLNGAFSDQSDPGETVRTDQAEVMSRDEDDAAASGAMGGDADADDAADMEAIEEEAGDEAGDGAAAPTIVTPEAAADSDDGEAEPDADDDSAEAEAEAEDGVDAAELAPLPGDADSDDAEDAADEAAAPGASISATPETSAARIQESDGHNTLAFDASDAGGADASASDRRLWRIAEFSLIVLIGVLITAMIVLPRLGRRSPRTASD